MYKTSPGSRISAVCSPSASSSMYLHTFNCDYYAQKSPMISYKPYTTRHGSSRVLLRSRGSSAGSVSTTNRLLLSLRQLVLCVLDQPVPNSLVQDLAAIAGIPQGQRHTPNQPSHCPPAASTAAPPAVMLPVLPLGEGLGLLCP